MSHVTFRLSHVTYYMWNVDVDPLDMLNNFCFHVYAQKSLFIVENCNGIFWDILVLVVTLFCYIRVHRAGSQMAGTGGRLILKYITTYTI